MPHISLFIIALLFASYADLQAQVRVPAPPDTVGTIIRIPVTHVHVRRPEWKGATQVDRPQLDLYQANTLGETLRRVPGVQQTYFGPNSSAPMIRSLSGNRVRVMDNGISANDLSGISPNLNIMLDMDDVAAIDVYKSGANVLYGGRAIGGAVNLLDETIPKARSKRPIGGKASLEGSTNLGHRQALSLHGNLGSHWVWHIAGMNRATDQVRIPGNTKAPIAYDPNIDHLTAAMAQVHVERLTEQNRTLYPFLSRFVQENLGNPGWDLSPADLYTFTPYSVIDGVRVDNPANALYIPGQDPNTPRYTSTVLGITDYAPVAYGRMPNSHAQSRSMQVGVSYLREQWRVGIGFKSIAGYFGVPGFALTRKPAHSHEPVQALPEYAPINTRSLSRSLLLESAYLPKQGPLAQIDLRYHYQTADDRELVGIYRVNKFESLRHGLRVEAVQQPWKNWHGRWGLDASATSISGDGVQRYLPNVAGMETGVFTSQQLDWNPVMLRAGYRRDWVSRRATPDDGYKPSRGLAGGKLSARHFALQQANASLRWQVVDLLFLQASVSHAERAPDFNELYAGNDHFALLIEENGDDRLPHETAQSYELGAGIRYHGFRLSGTFYQTVFRNYLYLAHTGISRSGGFLVKEWRASDTQITGVEAEWSYQKNWAIDRTWEFSGFFDLVKNRNTADDSLRQWAEGDFMPNLPTSRYGVAAAFGLGSWQLNAAMDRYLEQQFLGKNINPEPPMPAYTLISARLGYRLTLWGQSLLCYLDGSNLLNAEARPQNSPLKYLAPLPGRNLALGVRLSI